MAIITLAGFVISFCYFWFSTLQQILLHFSELDKKVNRGKEKMLFERVSYGHLSEYNIHIHIFAT